MYFFFQETARGYKPRVSSFYLICESNRNFYPFLRSPASTCWKLMVREIAIACLSWNNSRKISGLNIFWPFLRSTNFLYSEGPSKLQNCWSREKTRPEALHDGDQSIKTNKLFFSLNSFIKYKNIFYICKQNVKV